MLCKCKIRLREPACVATCERASGSGSGRGDLHENILLSFMGMLGVCSTSPILVKNNPNFGVAKIIRLKVIDN